MDNIAAYGSDEEDSGDEVKIPVPKIVASATKNFSLPPPRGFIDALPAPSRADGPARLTSTSAGEKKNLPSPALPPPFGATTNSIFNSLPQPTGDTSAREKKKRVVTFTPTFDTSLLDRHDDDDDDFPSKKVKCEAVTTKPAGGGLSGLVSFLPPPKHTLGLGSSLGGGGAGGRKLAMDTTEVDVSASETSPSSSRLPHGSSSDPNQVPRISKPEARSVNTESTFAAYPPETQQHHWNPAPGRFPEGSGGTAAGSAYGYPPEPYPPQNYSAGMGQGRGWAQGVAGGVGVEDNSAYAMPNPDTGNGSVEGEAAVEDPLTQVFATEIRRGKRTDSLNVVEVKMADLTKGREEQLRVTSIAFGPTYRSVASEKEGLTKLSRRKHQIGSLYQDMRSKQLEMTDRRARGHLTKAETHAKYGW